MALNGLDSSIVLDAYKAALAEPGGWFLLNYTSRDEVDVHNRGSGGVTETVEALQEYDSKSPLYGFIHYRNKTILLKYIPQGTSRLLQARTSVHWSTVTDTFSPHDALCEATSPLDLNDEALSALCGLPPEGSLGPSPARTPIATPSPAPSTRPVTPVRNHASPAFDERSVPSRTNFYDDDSINTPRAHVRTPNQASTSSVSAMSVPSPVRHTQRDQDPPRPDTRGTDSFDRPKTQPNAQPKYEPRSRANMDLAAFLSEVPPPPPAPFSSNRKDAELREFSPSPDSSAYRPSNDLLEPPKTSYSTRSGRPSTSDIWRSFKPKLKLHPRPVENQPPPPSAGVRQKLPTGLKVRSRKDKTDDRPKSRKSEKDLHVQESIMTSANAPPRTSSRPNLANDYRTRSPESEPPLPPLPTNIEIEHRPAVAQEPVAPPPVESKPEPVPPPPPAKFDKTGKGYGVGRQKALLGIDTDSAQTNRMSADTFALLSPEKQRLMKALELRKKQLKTAPPTQSTFDAPEIPISSLATAKTDSGVDIEEIRAAEAERSRPAPVLAPPVPLAATPSRPSTARRHNPALQSHPTGDIASFASPPSQPPLPPPPKVLPAAQKREHSIPRKELPRPPTSNNDSLSPTTDSTPRPGSDESRRRQDKRRGFFQPAPDSTPSPVSREDSAEASEGIDRNPLLLRELESATVEEATSRVMPVKQANAAPGSRSATPVMIERSSSRRNRPIPPEVAANAPAAAGSSPPSPEYARPNTSSAVGADRPGAGRKVNVSTGISRRIHALAEMNGHESRSGSPYGASSMTSDPTQSFLAPSALPQINTSSQSFLARSYDDSRASSPTRSFRRGLATRQSNDSQRTIDTATGKKRDTVSITAHIQRNHQAGRPLIIEEEGYEGSSPVEYSRPLHSRTISRTSTSRTDAQRPGSSHSNRPVSRGSTVTSFTRTSLDVWRPGGQKRFQSSMRPPTSASNVSLDRVDEVSETNRSSRTSKLLKRMSGFGGNKQKSPSESESVPSMEERRMLSPPRPTSIIVGDLNVQFPDSLLWKRRWVEVDGSGHIVLSASPSHDLPNGSRKKYRLADFRQPALPGLDRAELPHSITLDFMGGGGTLQLATQDPVGQASILRRLGDAHRAWLYYET